MYKVLTAIRVRKINFTLPIPPNHPHPQKWRKVSLVSDSPYRRATLDVSARGQFPSLRSWAMRWSCGQRETRAGASGQRRLPFQCACGGTLFLRPNVCSCTMWLFHAPTMYSCVMWLHLVSVAQGARSAPCVRLPIAYLLNYTANTPLRRESSMNTDPGVHRSGEPHEENALHKVLNFLRNPLNAFDFVFPPPTPSPPSSFPAAPSGGEPPVSSAGASPTSAGRYVGGSSLMHAFIVSALLSDSLSTTWRFGSANPHGASTTCPPSLAEWYSSQSSSICALSLPSISWISSCLPSDEPRHIRGDRHITTQSVLTGQR